MFKIRTKPVEAGTVPYAWGVASVYQCTWYAYYRALEVGFSAPTWWDRLTQQGSYPNAKDWIENFRDPWEVKDPSYKPVAGDILVYDGEYGHVIFCETDVMTSEYRNGDPNSFRNAKLGDYKANLLGILHYPYESVLPVERNENVNQIQTTDESLMIRTEPSLSGEIVGHVMIGFYNVLDIVPATNADKKTYKEQKGEDLKEWYEIAKDRWCANVTVTYLPSYEDDIIKQIERYFNEMKQQVNVLKDENTELKKSFKEVYTISKKWAE